MSKSIFTTTQINNDIDLYDSDEPFIVCEPFSCSYSRLNHAMTDATEVAGDLIELSELPEQRLDWVVINKQDDQPTQWSAKLEHSNGNCAVTFVITKTTLIG